METDTDDFVDVARDMMALAGLVSEDYVGGECEVLSSSPSLARLRLTPQDVGVPVEFEVSPYPAFRLTADRLREDVDVVQVVVRGRPGVLVSPVPSAVLAVALR